MKTLSICTAAALLASTGASAQTYIVQSQSMAFSPITGGTAVNALDWTSTDLFLDRRKPSYVGGILEMANARLYRFWGDLTEALKTGQPQNEAKREENYYDNLCENHDRLAQFMRAMDGVSMRAAVRIAEQFPSPTGDRR